MIPRCIMKLLLLPTAVTALAALTARPASAQFVFDLTATNLSGYTGPFAQVSVNLDSPDTATLTFTSLIKGGNIDLFGGAGAVGANVNAASWTLGTVSGSNAGTGFSPGPWTNGGAGNEDGFGSFNQTINSFDGYQHSSDKISFTLTNTSGTWASDKDVLAKTSSGYLAGAHIFITSSPANVANGAIITGYAVGTGEGGGGGGGPVPEPGTYGLLIGMGAFCLPALRMRLRRAA